MHRFDRNGRLARPGPAFVMTQYGDKETNFWKSQAVDSITIERPEGSWGEERDSTVIVISSLRHE